MKRRLSSTPIFLWLIVGCTDPCAGATGEPTLTLAGSSDDGTSFELFDDGGERSLIQGPQVGMHVWLQLRLEGFCNDNVDIDRRVFDSSDALVEVQRSPVRLTDGVASGSLELEQPLTMQLCPTDRPIIGQLLRFAVRAEDDQGHVDIAEKTFVPVCVSGECGVCTSP